MDFDIEPGIRDYLEKVRLATLARAFPSDAERRRVQMEHLALTVSPRPGPSLAVRDAFITAEGREISLRVYRPVAGAGRKPLVLFIHGGGWVAGSIETHDYLAAALAEGVGCVVVSVHYRRAPENRHPAQLDDCYAALCWASEQAEHLGADPNRIAVAGDSAGAHLATSCAIRTRDRHGPALRFQVLIYPMIEPLFYRDSHLAFADAPGLTRADCIYFWRCFLGEAFQSIPAEAVPTASALGGLPPAAIVTAEFDPLRDEGESYARRLEEEGVAVDLRRAPRLIHGFMRAGPFSAAVRRETERLCGLLRIALNHPE